MKTCRNQNNWKKKYEDLQEMFQEMSDYLQEVVTQQQSQAESIDYLSDYIAYKGLEEDFNYFRENAHRETNEDTPFPRYVI